MILYLSHPPKIIFLAGVSESCKDYKEEEIVINKKKTGYFPTTGFQGSLSSFKQY